MTDSNKSAFDFWDNEQDDALFNGIKVDNDRSEVNSMEEKIRYFFAKEGHPYPECAQWNEDAQGYIWCEHETVNWSDGLTDKDVSIAVERLTGCKPEI